MSQYAPNHMIGKHNHFMLRDFFASTMTDSRIALVGVGVDTMHLTRMADLLHLTKEKGPADGKIQAAVGELGVAQKVSFSYSDSCLVGASVKAGGKDAGKAVQALAKVLRSAAVTEQELTGAK